MAAGTVTPWGRCQEAETKTRASDWCLSSEADSHQTKAPIERRESKPVFRRQREQGGSPLRPEKDGLASGGRRNGALLALSGLFRCRFENPPEINVEGLSNAKKNIESWFPKITLQKRNHAHMKTCSLGEHVHGEILPEAFGAQGLDDGRTDNIALGGLGHPDRTKGNEGLTRI